MYHYDEEGGGSPLIWLLMLGIILFVVFGCSTPREYNQLTGQVAEYGVQSIEDKKNGNICYVYRDGDWSALSCLPKKK